MECADKSALTLLEETEMKKALLTAGFLLGIAPFSASALTVTFGGVDPGDGSFLTSALTPLNANNPTAGIFVDTFDRPASLGGGCGFNSAALGVATTGNYRFETGNALDGRAAAPANDTTCYVSGPNVLLSNQPGGNSVTIDFTAALASTFLGRKIDYLGFYWGSIDRYNSMQFFANGAPITIASINGNALNDTVLDGDDVLQFGGNAGDRQNPNTNRYVNFFFDSNEQFDKIVLTSTQYAMEIDNVAVRVAIPEPSAILLVGTALLGLAASANRRRKLTAN